MEEKDWKAGKVLYDGAVAPEHVAQHELTSQHVKELAGRGLGHPDKLTRKEVQDICGSVMAHITRLESERPSVLRRLKGE